MEEVERRFKFATGVTRWLFEALAGIALALSEDEKPTAIAHAISRGELINGKQTDCGEDAMAVPLISLFGWFVQTRKLPIEAPARLLMNQLLQPLNGIRFEKIFA